MKRVLLGFLLLSPAVCIAGHELPIEIMEIVGEKTTSPNESAMTSSAPLTAPVHDAGALLRAITGMDAARRGGRGFDPVIRGQSQNQINVISDGAYNFGSCPSRMDPPSTYVGFDNFDKVTVIKGNRTVIHGSGGSGGTIIFEHQRPDFSEQNILGEAVAGYTSNSDIDSASANVALGNERGFVRLFGEQKSSGNYDDADGNTVSAAFDSNNTGIVAGWDLTKSDYIEASFERANEEDLFYAGNGMDAPYADSSTTRIRWVRSSNTWFLDSFELNAYRSDVDHLMDNYTLRDRNPMMMNGMATPTSSDTFGGRFLGTIETDSSEIKLGFDYLGNNRRARMFMDMGKNGVYNMLAAYMWPDVEQRQLGIFAEWDYQLTDKDLMRIGLRYDQFEMEATKANEPAGMMASATPATLYASFYGTDQDELENNDASLVLGWDRNMEGDTLFSANLSRSVRNPDTNEAFMARRTMGSNPTHWVGNPEIESEIHHQLDLTLMGQTINHQWSVTVFWNEVDNYIERFNDSDGNTLYRNINASLRGTELELSSDISDNISSRVGISYTRGEGDNGDLANIAPLTGNITLNYQRDTWAVGSEVVAADRQTNFDADVDVPEETPGFVVMNLYSHWQAFEQFTLEAGVENLFDKKYAYHVNKASVDPFDPTAIRVNEPGRQYWVRMRYSL